MSLSAPANEIQARRMDRLKKRSAKSPVNGSVKRASYTSAAMRRSFESKESLQRHILSKTKSSSNDYFMRNPPKLDVNKTNVSPAAVSEKEEKAQPWKWVQVENESPIEGEQPSTSWVFQQVVEEEKSQNLSTGDSSSVVGVVAEESLNSRDASQDASENFSIKPHNLLARKSFVDMLQNYFRRKKVLPTLLGDDDIDKSYYNGSEGEDPLDNSCDDLEASSKRKRWASSYPSMFSRLYNNLTGTNS